MKQRILLFASLAFFCFSCGNEQPEQKNDSATSDSLTALTDSLPQTAIALSLGGDTIEPADPSQILYRFDEKMIRDKQDPLSVKEVSKRFMPADTNCDSEALYTLKRFFYLDSMNRAGDHSYSDLGQTVKVEMRLIDTIPVSPDFITVAWTMYYSTYEACPFSAGSYFMVSTYSKSGKLISTQLMGRQTSGGDAPMSFSSSVKGNLFRDGSFKSLQADTTEDADVEGKGRYDISQKIFRGSIDKNGKIFREEMVKEK